MELMQCLGDTQLCFISFRVLIWKMRELNQEISSAGGCQLSLLRTWVTYLQSVTMPRTGVIGRNPQIDTLGDRSMIVDIF